MGERNAQALARAFGTLDALMAATPEQIEAVPGLGKVIGASVAVALKEEGYVTLLNKLKAAGVNPQEEEVRRGEQLGA